MLLFFLPPRDPFPPLELPPREAEPLRLEEPFLDEPDGRAEPFLEDAPLLDPEALPLALELLEGPRSADRPEPAEPLPEEAFLDERLTSLSS